MNPEIDDQKEYTVEEYLAMEEVAEARHEYRAGKVVAMSGGTRNHGRIGRNISTALHNMTFNDKYPCETFNNDIKVYVEKYKSYVYPDAYVVCGDVENDEKDKEATTNPVLVVEVLSNSTEKYDRTTKFRKYCSLPSFKEYILIDQYQPIVDILYREDLSYQENVRNWKMQIVIGSDQSIYINTLDCKIPMSTIYKNVTDLIDPSLRPDV